MKKFLLTFFVVLMASVFSKAEIVKHTYIYNVTEQGDTLCLDRYTDSFALKGRPAVIFAFGGSFRSGSRDASEYLPFFNFLATKGIDAISIDYRTTLKDFDPHKGVDGFVGALQNAISTAVSDFFDATSYVIYYSGEWGIDPSKIIASGSSAGAITALQAENVISNYGYHTDGVPTGFNYAGVISFAGAVCSAGEPTWDKKRLCPIMMFHGDVDTMVPFDYIAAMGMGLYGSKFISSQLDSMAKPFELYIVNNADHRIAVDPMKHNLYDILAFIEEFVVGKAKRATIVNQAVPGASKDYKTDFSLMDFLQSYFK